MKCSQLDLLALILSYFKGADEVAKKKQYAGQVAEVLLQLANDAACLIANGSESDFDTVFKAPAPTALRQEAIRKVLEELLPTEGDEWPIYTQAYELTDAVARNVSAATFEQALARLLARR